MPRITCVTVSFVLTTALTCALANAQTGACQPLTDAMTLLARTPNHQYISETAAYKHGTRESEVIETGTTLYLKVNGKWHSQPYEAKAKVTELGRAVPARNSNCTNAGSNDVDGQAAVLFRVHDQNDDDVIESQVWIGANGLPLRQVIDTDVGGALGKSHREIRFDYANAQAPKL